LLLAEALKKLLAGDVVQHAGEVGVPCSSMVQTCMSTTRHGVCAISAMRLLCLPANCSSPPLEPIRHTCSQSLTVQTLADRIVTDHDRKGPEAVSLFFAKYYANYES